MSRVRPEVVDRLADIFVGPKATGRGDGSGPNHTVAFHDLSRVVVEATPGTVIEIVADQGPYVIEEPITIKGGGSPGTPITIRGPLDGPFPILRGDRTDPYSPEGEPGPSVFRLAEGANHLVFAHLHCERAGNGCFSVVAGIADLTIVSVTARNVRRFLENGTSSAARDATIHGLTISDVQVKGFSKGAVRLGHQTNDVLIIDVFGDSQHQDGDNYAIGVHLVDSVHDVRLERVSMSNALDTLHPYWNGDGFATERGVNAVLLVDTTAVGNSDAGYDIKSSATILEDATAERNARNFRLWGEQIDVDGCSGIDPVLQGGTGAQIQVQLLETATVEMRDCAFRDSDPSTVVFSIEDSSELNVVSTVVEHAPFAELAKVATGAELTQQEMKVSTG